jgi:hypothetical protein
MKPFRSAGNVKRVKDDSGEAIISREEGRSSKKKREWLVP